MFSNITQALNPQLGILKKVLWLSPLVSAVWAFARRYVAYQLAVEPLLLREPQRKRQQPDATSKAMC